MPDLPHTDLLDLAYPYALDALSDEQRRAVEDLLDSADETAAATFRSTVYELRETLAMMTVADAVPAPEHLEATLLQAIGARPGGDGPAPQKDASGTAAPDDRVASLDRAAERRARASRRTRLLAAAAAVVVVVGGAGVGIAVYRSQSHDRGEVTAQQVIEHADTRGETSPITGGGTITVRTSHELGAAVVSFDTVPSPPTDRTYQLWLLSPAGVPRSAGVLGPLPGPQSPKLVQIGDAGKLALTIEPDGGSPAPTTDPIVGVPLT